MRIRHLVGLAAVALLATAAVVGLASGSAGACSLIAHQITATQPATVGAPITATGTGFFHLDGDPGDLAADCTGADFVADTEISLVATFTTPAGPATVTKAVTVNEGGSFDLEPTVFDPPTGATAVSITAVSATDATYSVPPFELRLAQPLSVDSTSTPPPTTSAPPVDTATAPPAVPVPADAKFTG